MSATETTPTQAPEWLAEMDFCHILPSWSATHRYCGEPRSPLATRKCSGVSTGEAICPKCGRPTCPRCAQLSALDNALRRR